MTLIWKVSPFFRVIAFLLAFSFVVVIFFTVTITVAFFPLFRVTVTFAVPAFFPVSFPVLELTVTTEVLRDFQLLMASPFPKVTVGPAMVFFSGTVIFAAESLIVAFRFAMEAVSFSPQTVQVRSFVPVFRTVAATVVL